MQMDPKLESAEVIKGYLQLPADWIRANPNFRLDIPMAVRKISPHPYTNQNVIALARGPLIYCLEDVDNPWVNDHFKVSSSSLMGFVPILISLVTVV